MEEDFIENFTVAYNLEPQPLHFGGNTKQVALYVAVCYYADHRMATRSADGELTVQKKKEVHGFFSDDLTHDYAFANYCHLAIIQHYNDHSLGIDRLHIWLDGCRA